MRYICSSTRCDPSWGTQAADGLCSTRHADCRSARAAHVVGRCSCCCRLPARFLLLLAACSLLAAAVGCLLASCFSVHQRWTASRLRTPIKHPLCITSNFSNFSNFLLASQQLFPEGYGHFDRRNDLEPALRAKSAASGNRRSQQAHRTRSRSDRHSRYRTR